MVHIVLVSTKGNGVRYFPYTGYLGLTPLKVEGVVVTRRDGDMKPLPSKSITVSVRCYESRVGRLGAVVSNVLVDHTQVLWSKPDGQDYADIADEEFPFRITVPARVAGFSTASFVEYKCIWRVEAVLNHMPFTGIGTRQVKHCDIPLFRYDLPPHISLASDSNEIRFTHQTTKPRAPKIRYCINCPSIPIGPLDLVTIPIHLQPLDPSVSIRSASVIIERRIELLELSNTSASSLPSPQSPTSASFTSSSLATSHSSRASSAVAVPVSSISYSASAPASYKDSSSSHVLESTTSVGSSNPTITPHTIYPSASDVNLLSPPSSSPFSSAISPEPQSIRTVVHPVTGTSSSGPFTRSNSGVWSKTLTLQWPNHRSNSRWAVGETLQSDLASIKFILRTKIVASSPSGTDSFDLEEKEILIVSTNEAERELAISKYNEAADAARSKSKSPGRRRKDPRESEAHPPVPSTPSVPSVDQATLLDPSRQKPAEPSPPGHHYKKNGALPRRPHTSAGPRDKQQGGFPRPETTATSQRQDASMKSQDSSLFQRRRSARPATGKVGATEVIKTNVFGHIFSPKLSPTTSTGPKSPTRLNMSNSTSNVSDTSQESDHMREWEEELNRIEVQSSRRSLNMFGFRKKKSRANTDPVQGGHSGRIAGKV